MALPPTLGPADESYLLYGAKRVLEGQALYRDFFDFVTPGSYYLYALAYAVGGVSITSARVTTALLQALSATCAYFLALRVASMAEAILAGVLVVVICVPVWNMASHHWIATALGLATAAVLLAARGRGSTRARPAAAGALTGMVVCTSTSRGVWLIPWLAITVPALALVRGDVDRWRRCRRELAWTAAGGATVCVAVLGYAVWRSSFGEVVYATATWAPTRYGGYDLAWMGGLWLGRLDYTYGWLFEAIPALLGVEAVTLLWALWRDGLGTQLVRAALLLLTLSAIGGIMYYPDPVHVAFVLPFVLVALAGMVYRARTAFAFAATPAATRVARLAWLVVLAIMLAKGWRNARLAWEEHPILYNTAFGTLAGTELEVETIRDLRQRLAVDDGAPPRLFAYPGDAWIYLALPADNPTRFALLFPGYNTAEQMHETMDRLAGDPQAAVLVNTLFERPDDPFVALLHQHYRDVVGIGPRTFPGNPRYRLFVPDSTVR
jgi:hypothetical protein